MTTVVERRIAVECSCGRAYRVRDEWSGRAFRCKRCRRRVRVPDTAISRRTRASILTEVGIDPESSEAAYWAEKVETPDPEGPNALTANAPQVGPAIRWRRAVLLGIFLLLGITGFVHTLIGPPSWLTVVLAGTLAGAGAVNSAQTTGREQVLIPDRS